MACAVIERLVHPGPVAAQRSRALPCAATPLEVTLPAGVPLLDAVAGATGGRAAWLELTGAPMARLDHLRPGPDPTGDHAAWYDGPHGADGAVMTRLGLHLGRRAGQPWLHGHGWWTAPDGMVQGGHVVPGDTALAEPVRARGWSLTGAALEVSPDPETRFDLFQPVATTPPGQADALLLTLRPNQDMTRAIEQVASAHGIRSGTVHGLGSLVAPRFADARCADGGDKSFATEILITEGRITGGRAALSAMVVGFGGQIAVAALERGGCGVCVTCELLLRRG